MPSQTQSFYKNLPSFSQFIEISKDRNYEELPLDWFLLLTDVQDSTEAVAAGRYREVNMLGASTISAVLNALPGLEFPYVFGGDGATIALPNEKREEALRAIQSVQKIATDSYGMKLRAGYVTVETLKKNKATVRVGKYALTEKNCLAQFTGGGVALAEKMIKGKLSNAVLFEPNSETVLPNLKGLSCRWEPFKSRKGQILTLIIQPFSNSLASMEEVIRNIEMALRRPLREANPVNTENMKIRWPAKTFGMEKFSGTRLRLLWESFFMQMLFDLNAEINGFSGPRYKKEMELLSDFRKLDDALRMVLDCTKEEGRRILTCLESLADQDVLEFGSHTSSEALMTCLVFSASQGKHVHFIDGSNGGYTLAAKELKSRFMIERRKRA